MSGKRLIINADDLGYSQGVNHAIARCAREGPLRSATIMAGGPAFDHAVDLMRDLPEVGVGVHLTLTELQPTLPGERIHELLDGSGRLHLSAGALLPLLLTRRAARDALRRELSGQMEKVLLHDIQPTHVDTHKHLHAFPIVLNAVLEVAQRFGVRWIRNPFDDTSLLSTAGRLDGKDRQTFLGQSAKGLAIRMFKPYFRARLLRHGMVSPSHFFGVGLTGVWNERAFAHLAARLPSGLSEVMFHPGDYDAELRRNRTRLLEQRQKERDLLISNSFRDMIRSRNISVVRYGEVIP